MECVWLELVSELAVELAAELGLELITALELEPSAVLDLELAVELERELTAELDLELTAELELRLAFELDLEPKLALENDVEDEVTVIEDEVTVIEDEVTAIEDEVTAIAVLEALPATTIVDEVDTDSGALDELGIFATFGSELEEASTRNEDAAERELGELSERLLLAPSKMDPDRSPSSAVKTCDAASDERS